MALFARGKAQIFYEVVGPKKSSAWVTLVNGHARSSTDFRAFARFLEEKGFSVLVFDNRGSGKTETRPFTFPEMIGDVVGLWEHLKIKKSHLLGISYGGVICQKLAAQETQSVRSLALVSTTAESRYLDFGRRLAELSSDERQIEMMNYFGKEFHTKNLVLSKSLVKSMASAFEDPEFLKKARLQRAALGVFDFRFLQPRIKCPTLILHGAEDQIISPQSARDIHKGIAGSELEVWDGIGHLFLAEAPKRFYERVAEFFEKNS